MSEPKKRKIATFDKTLTPEQAEAEKRKPTILGAALRKADKLEQQKKQ
jgi:hypothetical protein